MASSESERILVCPGRKERRALLAEAFEGHRARLRLLVEMRLSPRLAGRIDPSDVLQDDNGLADIAVAGMTEARILLANGDAERTFRSEQYSFALMIAPFPSCGPHQLATDLVLGCGLPAECN